MNILKPNQTSKMELFAKIVVSAVNDFRKKLHPRLGSEYASQYVCKNKLVAFIIRRVTSDSSRIDLPEKDFSEIFFHGTLLVKQKSSLNIFDEIQFSR